MYGSSVVGVSMTARVTDVLGTVLNTACAPVVASSSNTPLRVIVQSASSRMRSLADLPTPVTSWVARGVDSVQLVTSSVMVCASVLASVQVTAPPRPDSLLTVISSSPYFCALASIS